MKQIYLSDNGPKVSQAIYGFWRWTNNDLSTPNKFEKTVELCLNLGINTFDFADLFCNFNAEEEFGKLLQTNIIAREKVVLFSNGGQNNKGKTAHPDSSRNFLFEGVDNTLKKLNTDYLDVFLLNKFDYLTDIEELASTLFALVDSKKVKHIGLANFSQSEHELISSVYKLPIVTSHVELNLLKTDAIKDGRINFLKQHYSKPLAWAPLAGGRITNGTDPEAVKLREKLAEIQEKYNTNIEAIAVAWLHKLGALPLLGTLDENRLSNAVKAFEIELSNEDWYLLFNI